MDVRMKTVPNNRRGEPVLTAGERDLVFFKVVYNHFRDVSGSTVNEVTDREEWAECECCLCLPESYSDSGEETPLVIFCHGSGGRVSEEGKMIGGIENVLPCVDAGYAVLDVNGSELHGITVGCPEHIAALYKAYRHAVKHYNVSDRVLVGGGSMGGQVALNFANTYPSITLALGLFYPRLNMDGVEINGRHIIGSWEKEKNVDKIEACYRFHKPGEWCEDTTVGFNPYRSRSFINADGERVVIPPCPIKLWQGMDDVVVDPAMAEEFIRSCRRSGSFAELRMLEGRGHGPNSVMRQELVMWFNRFI